MRILFQPAGFCHIYILRCELCIKRIVLWGIHSKWPALIITLINLLNQVMYNYVVYVHTYTYMAIKLNRMSCMYCIRMCAYDKEIYTYYS